MVMPPDVKGNQLKTGALQGKQLISVVTACYNEEENVEDVYREIKKIRDKHDEYKCLTKRLNAWFPRF